MMPNYSSEIWPTLGTALGNHLWQSTLFAIAAGLLTLALRKNHAQARYWLWLAASVKFLIPFSLLVALGSHLAWTHGATGANTGVYVAMEEFTQPFATTTLLPVAPSTPQTNYASMVHLLPTLLGVVWFCGFLAVSLVGYLRWSRVSASIRRSVPLREGREVEVLRRLESSGGIRKPIPLLSSAGSLEPGIFGIARPVLVWPEGISERLEDAHLQAIVAHEVCHVRRRDNLAAAVHMLVEAIFWFHPLVWWMGVRLVEERERACDEEVLNSGTERQVYAESILKICEFCVGSPLACVSGVTGADLKKRIARIMTQGFARKLDFSRKLLLSGAGFLAVTLPLMFGVLHATQGRAAEQERATSGSLTYATVLVKPTAPTEPGESKPFPTRMLSHPGEFSATGVTLGQLIRTVYGVEENQISGGPDWIGSSKFDVQAKMEKSVLDQMNALNPDQRSMERSRMLQAILADHFKLTLHHETKELPVYVMVATKNGAKLHEARPGDTYPDGFKGLDGRPAGAGKVFSDTQKEAAELTGQGVSVSELAAYLSMHVHTKVLDKTGLTSKYDVTLRWTPSDKQPALFAAIKEQLGLDLEPQTAPMDVLVIDHAEKPLESQARQSVVLATGFESSSIKPSDPSGPAGNFMFGTDSFTGTKITLQMLIRSAYGVEDAQISGGPSWLNSEKYDIDAKMGQATVQKLQKLGDGERFAEWRRMVQALLEERFKLTVHRETKEVPGYALVITKNGSRLHESKPGDTYPNGIKGPDGQLAGAGTMHQGVGELTVQGLPMRLVAHLLSEQLGREIVDETGLAGTYDFALNWTPDESQPPMFRGMAQGQPGAGNAFAPTHSGPSIYAAIQEQLGLKLEPQNVPLEVLVIDHAEKPVEK